MLPPTPKMNDSLLNSLFSNLLNSMNQNKISEPSEEKKILNREPSALSSNVILLIELGIVLIVILVVGLVFYLSHRNSKKRCNRRRWMQSDINIDNSNDCQIYDTTADERQAQHNQFRRLTNDNGNGYQTNDPTSEDRHPRTIVPSRDDCPPPYESVVQQKKRRRSRNSKSHVKRLDRQLPKRNYANNDEALLSPRSLTYISTICNENSSLIENQQSASTSAPGNTVPKSDGEQLSAMRENCLNDDFTVNNDELQKVLLARTTGETGTTNEKQTTTMPTKTARCENGMAVLDASGLPTYDTALRIQECGNM